MLYRTLFFCLILQGLFAQTQANLEPLLNQLNQIDPAHLKQARQIVEEKSLPVSQKSCQACFKNKCTAPTLSKDQEVKSDLIVFVSFSLSEGALKQLYRDVQQVGGRLVIRGLYHNSFRKTQEKIHALGIAVEIDPRLFEQLKIQNVPSFVLMKMELNQQIDGDISFDVLKGNVSLSYALERFREEASLEGRVKASQLLDQLKKGAR